MIPWEATIGSRIRWIRTFAAILPDGITQYSAMFFFFSFGIRID